MDGLLDEIKRFYGPRTGNHLEAELQVRCLLVGILNLQVFAYPAKYPSFVTSTPRDGDYRIRHARRE